jgi:hypothetical protein
MRYLRSCAASYEKTEIQNNLRINNHVFDCFNFISEDEKSDEHVYLLFPGTYGVTVSMIEYWWHNVEADGVKFTCAVELSQVSVDATHQVSQNVHQLKLIEEQSNVTHLSNLTENDRRPFSL